MADPSAQVEYLDCDGSTDELFIYYLRERAFDLESMVNDYNTLWGVNIPVYNDTTVIMDNYALIYGGMVADPVGTTRLTEQEQKDILNYVRYTKSTNYNALTSFSLHIEDYGNNLERNGAIHWYLFLLEYNNCDLQWLINEASAENNLTLENFDCPYSDASYAAARALACSEYNTYISSFVADGDKTKKEIVHFKTFLQRYNPPVRHNSSATTIQDDYYNDLVADSIHSHTKSNVVTRLEATKRWKRRVLAKLPPYRTDPSHD